MKRVNIKQLGRDLKETKSEKVFKELYEHCKTGVINYYLQFKANNIEQVEDAYIEAMTSIWNNIDKFDVEKYSISTMIYLKVKQNLINKNKMEELTNSSELYTDSVFKIMDEKCVDDFTINVEEQFINNERDSKLWSEIRDVLYTQESGDLTFNILYDSFYQKLSAEEVAKKYNTNIQVVANRIFHAKKKIKKNKEVYENYYY